MLLFSPQARSAAGSLSKSDEGSLFHASSVPAHPFPASGLPKPFSSHVLTLHAWPPLPVNPASLHTVHCLLAHAQTHQPNRLLAARPPAFELPRQCVNCHSHVLAAIAALEVGGSAGGAV